MGEDVDLEGSGAGFVRQAHRSAGQAVVFGVRADPEPDEVAAGSASGRWAQAPRLACAKTTNVRNPPSLVTDAVGPIRRGATI